MSGEQDEELGMLLAAYDANDPRNKQTVAASSIELKKYDQKHRGFNHLKLTIDKNMRLKRRKPVGCCCEVFLPPIFVMMVAAGYAAANLYTRPAQDYMGNTFLNTTSFVRDNIACIRGVPPTAPNPVNFTECPNNSNHFPLLTTITPPPGESWDADVRLDPSAGINRGVSFDAPTDIISFDSMVVLQKSAFYARGFDDGTSSDALEHTGNIEFALTDGVPCGAVQNVIKYMRENTLLFDTVYDPTNADGHAGSGSACPGVWPSESSVVDFGKGDGAETTWAAVVFNKIDDTSQQYDFKIRMNFTSTPSTRHPHKRFAQGLGERPYQQYQMSGFPTLQAVIGAALLKEPYYTPVVTCPMPTAQYKESEFYMRAANVLPLFLSFAYIYPVSRLVSSIVLEKEERQREGMLIMGLSRRSFYASWFGTYTILQTVSSLLIVLLTRRNMFQNSNPLIVFLLFWTFSESIIALSLLISVFFSKARIASLVSPLIMMLTTIPKSVINDEISTSSKTWLSLLSPSAFGYGSSLLCDYEGSGMGASFKVFASDDYSFALCIGMMILDTILYLALAWYLDNVFPSEWGVKRHPLFLCQPSYWSNTPNIRASIGDIPPDPPIVESYDAETTEKMKAHERIRITDLTKKFPGKPNPAVNHLGMGLPDNSLAFYEGQIQCILGHNGAGKTTLINMLTGMLQPETGDCRIWGKSILCDMDSIREDLGLCPQHNILWPDLTCREHLSFFAGLKGVPNEKLSGLVDQMLDLINLGSKKDAYARTLSGGQKRKLSVAIALIGGPRLVFLDEPTAGMDVESRRAMWHLLRRPEILKDRCIVLTTHYMDEADLLGDSVMIMENGRLHSRGSSFFLKQKLGVGYNLSLAMQTGCCVDAVEKVVKKHVPNAKYLSSSGNELKLQLPSYMPITDEVVQQTELSAVVKDKIFISDVSERAELVATLINNVSVSDTDKRSLEGMLQTCRAQQFFPDLFEDIDTNKNTLKIESYGVGVTTLEEVFMKIAMGETEAPTDRNVVGKGSENFKLYSITDPLSTPVAGMDLAVSQFKALVMKRVHSAKRDKRTLCFQFGLPVFFIGFALLLGRIPLPEWPSIAIGIDGFDKPLATPVGDEGSDLFSGCFGQNSCAFDPKEFTLQNVSTASISLSAWLLSNYFGHGNTDRVIAIAGDDRFPGLEAQPLQDIPAETTTFLANATWVASMPAALNIYQNAMLKKKAGPNAYIKTYNHPLPWSNYLRKVVKSFQVVITSLVILLPFTLLPSNYVSFIVKERESKAKHVQLVSGVKVTSYWLSSFVFDLCAYSVTLTIVLILFFIDGRDEFIGDAKTAVATILLFLMYGVSSVVNSYAVSFLFATHTQAQTAVSIANFITGFVLVVAAFILDLIESTHDVNEVLMYFYRIIPSYCLGEGLINLSSLTIDKAIGSSVSSPLAWDVVGRDLVFMLISIPLCMLITYGLEMWPAYRAKLRFAKEQRNMSPTAQVVEDSAVEEEKQAVLNGREGDLITVRHLRKEWPKKVAVHDLTFGVKRGELFAFLGTNGAGKTTTLSVLSGEFPPTSGSAEIGYNPKTGKGYDITTELEDVRKSLGLCPQFDALLDHLTPDEHLWLYCRLRGVPTEDAKESIETLIASLDLQDHRKKKAKALSGGNRRKLSVAIALIGGPPVIFLDEPSAGMDPVARRGLWRALEDACKDRCVVLTTHHLEEVEALAHRTAIMVDGALQCLGTLSHLKHKFGGAYEIQAKVVAEKEAEVVAFFASSFPDSKLIESTNHRLTYQMPAGQHLSQMFSTIQAARDRLHIVDYSISETSLEQVFIAICKKHMEEDAHAAAAAPVNGDADSKSNPLVTVKRNIQSLRSSMGL
eukprot:TRINITY_DN5539_c0_g1_i6.p1 TRINITY_DN5539_c0_g1~~TRINITY_DN5539_c0_g1_i6.p1  ORF type:complete len:1865 (+),score=612.43 TRINITY_DN5539_c0_g1_i6:40-5595(+)